jgi:hypothetical protein
MTIGTSIFLIACGAILRYAVTAEVDWININTAGLVLMIVGILGLVLGFFFYMRGRDPERVGAPPPPRRPL